MRFLVSRTAQAAVSIWGAVTIVFLALHLAGNPAAIIAGPTATAEQVRLIAAQLGLDKPLYVQYLAYLGHLVRADFGFSYAAQQPALAVFLSRLRYTAALASTGFTLALVLGLACGLAMARFGGVVERVLMAIVSGGQSLPSFWLGLLLILIFSVTLHWLPSSGSESWKAIILPTVTLASFLFPALARITRQSLLDELPSEYVRTARAKGMPDGLIWRKHLLRNAALPIVTIAALQLAYMLGGAVLTETVFAWPGVGQLTVQAVQQLDLPVVETIVIFAAVTFVGANLVADLLYSVLDPRVTFR